MDNAKYFRTSQLEQITWVPTKSKCSKYSSSHIKDKSLSTIYHQNSLSMKCKLERIFLGPMDLQVLRTTLMVKTKVKIMMWILMKFLELSLTVFVQVAHLRNFRRVLLTIKNKSKVRNGPICHHQTHTKTTWWGRTLFQKFSSLQENSTEFQRRKHVC